MGAETKIEWCDHSWSPWRGCTKVSPGCANCYAETLSRRNPAVLGQWGKGKPRVKAKNWNEPRKWNRFEVCPNGALPMEGAPGGHGPYSLDAIGGNCPECGAKLRRPTVFPSLCDWLDEEVPVEWLAEFLQLIHDTPNLTWLMLTKRPENWYRRLSLVAGELAKSWIDCIDMPERGAWPANVWVGTSVEDQPRADERIPALLKIPAAGRFLSLEPLLGPVDIREVKPLMQQFNSSPYGWHNWLRQRLHWLIIGGESGPGSRPCNVEWVRSLVAQGRAAGVPTFVKQLGAEPTFNAPRRIDDWGQEHISEGAWISAITHPKGGDPAEWPADLRVREFPTMDATRQPFC